MKLGQHVSAMEYIIPLEYCETMNVLHDEAMFRGFEEVVDVFKVLLLPFRLLFVVSLLFLLLISLLFFSSFSFDFPSFSPLSRTSFLSLFSGGVW